MKAGICQLGRRLEVWERQRLESLNVGDAKVGEKSFPSRVYGYQLVSGSDGGDGSGERDDGITGKGGVIGAERVEEKDLLGPDTALETKKS